MTTMYFIVRSGILKIGLVSGDGKWLFLWFPPNPVTLILQGYINKNVKADKETKC